MAKELELPTAKLWWTHQGRSLGLPDFQCSRGDVYMRMKDVLRDFLPRRAML